MSAAQIAAHVAALHRYGAIDVPHDMAGPNHAQRDLMRRAAAGHILNVAESARYRIAIQTVLAQHQTMFRLLDNNIIFATDAGPNMPNNCGGLGISGRHDLHSASAASNFAEMEASLAALSQSGFWGRVRHANRAYKSLTDLMVHLAPAAVSVMQADQPPLPDTANRTRAAAFDRFRSAMTRAGFSLINSPDYKAAIGQAMAAFEVMALEVQDAVTLQLTPTEQRLAGRWLAPQSISPRLELDRPSAAP
ncbi:MAG: hypothetical protein U5N55_08840 [Cypionkella sp.]|nr:hypothetical protein [Cypionkella sp.]